MRVSKHDLKVRPIFHWTEPRIRAHIVACFLALACARYPQSRYSIQQQPLSPKLLIRELMLIQRSVLQHVQTQPRYVIPGRIRPDAQKIYRVMGVTWGDIPHPLEK